MTTTVPAHHVEPAVPPFPVKRFGVDEYERLIAHGAFGDDERIELIDGFIVPKMTRNPPHDTTLSILHRLLIRSLPDGWDVRNQCAIVTEDSVPEPDLTIVRGELRRYQRQHPRPDDIALVIEVSDSSLEFDRTEKARIYARAGIPAYWIVNLVDGCIEALSGPLTAGGICQRSESFFPPATVRLSDPDLTVATIELWPDE